MSRTNTRWGFTLIELMVVIAIISILAAMLMPAFVQAKVSAKQAACILQVRQIGMALMMYRTDFDDVWVPAAIDDPEPGFAPRRMWLGYDNNNTGGLNGNFYGDITKPAIQKPKAGMIDNYIRSDQIKKCPAQPPEWQQAIAYSWFYSGFPSEFYNTHPGVDGNEWGPGGKITMESPYGGLVSFAASDSEIDEPAYTLAAWEHEAPVNLCNFLQSPDWIDHPPLDFHQDHFHFLHRNAGTALWADGHTKRILYKQLKRPMFACKKGLY